MVEIIQLPPEQWQRYRAIRLEALRTAPQAFLSRYEDYLERPESFWQGRLADAAAGETTWLLFAEEEGRIVGLVGAFAHSAVDAAEIVQVYVSPPARGRGVAQALMEAILHVVRETGKFRKATLTVNIAQTAAVRLYQRVGFQTVEQRHARMSNGQEAEEYYMEKALES